MPVLPVLRGVLLVALSAAAPSACTSALLPGGTEPLRVLVYNLHAGKDAEGRHNLERVAELIRESAADLVLLQEVDRGTARSGREDQLASLRRLTGLHGAFGRTIHFQGGEYGVALLSRWPIEADALRPLLPDPGAAAAYEPRGALVATVAAPGGAIRLLSTHLDASADDAYRVREVERVRALADSLRREGGLVLLGGDFNATPESRVVASLAGNAWTDAWAQCGAGEGATFPAREPVRRIDYLFLPQGVRCSSAAVLPSQASDHRPVLVVLNVKR